MLDFMTIAVKKSKKDGPVEIYPKFIIKSPSEDLMIRGGDFYAIWDEGRRVWCTRESDAVRLIDTELYNYAEEHKHKYEECGYTIAYMWDADSGSIDRWHKYCQKQMRDCYEMLDETLIFANTNVTKKDYASKVLPYPLEQGDISGYEKLISTLYTPEERHKLEWAIGSIVTGDSKKIQKFMVLYGSAGTGKSTVLNIIQKLFEGYYAVFDAKALGSASNVFALEAFKTNPLVAIQHDGDLSKIEDNTRLNSLVSHEEMTVNEKFKATYTNDFKAFLFMGTNRPVRITDAKSGLIRRLIDVTPSGNKLAPSEYKRTMKQVDFELGAIAYHCQEVYTSNPGYYDDYMPIAMMGASNDFYNFVIDSYHIFKNEDGTTLKAAWEMYKNYCEEAKVPYPFTQRVFKEELKNYFYDYKERFNLDDGTRVRSFYIGFREDQFGDQFRTKKEEPKQTSHLINFDSIPSIFDDIRKDCPAQYASAQETPTTGWDKVTTVLSDIDTSKLHYVRVPENHIVIDFDIKDKSGKKSFEKNLEEASKWPATYAELSKSGAGVHLHYIYKGDVSLLSRVYDENIEVKVFNGKSSLRRKLTKCNNLPIATISAGLPLKGEKNMVNFEVIKNEKALRTLIKRNLNKEYHASTKSSIDFIHKILEDAYASGIGYDVSDMFNAVLAFAANSTNQSLYCITLVNKMKFKSKEPSLAVPAVKDKLIFYDVEVFPNLFLVNYKVQGEDKPVVRLINPTPSDIADLIQYNLVGFNCRRYDNHMLHARLIGYSNEQLFELSQKIINSKKGENREAFFGEAYNISYTDVHDFAAKKQSLKKWEIELGIHHQELGLPWDQPVPEELWTKVAEYCDNDVIATEAVFNHLKADFVARQILADLASGCVNDTTNSLTTKIIFGNNKNPQSQFNYRNMAEPVYNLAPSIRKFLENAAPEMMAEPHGEARSELPYFPGYKYENGKSTYKGVEVGEGGRVYAKPGMYFNVALLDIASMHPHSVIAEALFGVEFTKRFKEIVDGRVSIKHEAWSKVDNMLGGKLKPYIQKVLDGEMTSKDLANALKIAINSVYGLTAANFPNAFRDPRNKDNIVAKRGALFMVDLQEAVEACGFTVAHIKTDSIKIPNATPEIIQFVMEFGKRYGYTFEHEATYDRMCLVNDAVYIAKYKDGDWTATGTQFRVPYVFKTLFTKEPITFDDLCETKEVKSAIYLDMNEKLTDVSDLEKQKEKLRKNIDNSDKVEELDKLIAEGHDYRFIGKVGNFCPVKPGCGGGLLVREQNGKYNAVTGTKGYRWLEAETLKNKIGEEAAKDSAIDKSYYNALVDDAIDVISQYGDFEMFVSDDPNALIPPWETAGDPWEEDFTAFDIR